MTARAILVTLVVARCGPMQPPGPVFPDCHAAPVGDASVSLLMENTERSRFSVRVDLAIRGGTEHHVTHEVGGLNTLRIPQAATGVMGSPYRIVFDSAAGRVERTGCLTAPTIECQITRIVEGGTERALVSCGDVRTD